MRLLPRTLMDYIRQPEAGRCWNCMVLSTEITAPAVENSLIFPQFWGWRACRAVSAAVSSSRTSSSTKRGRGWSRYWSGASLGPSAAPIPSSSAVPALVVYPAAGLIRYFRGDHLVVINMQPTNADAEADLCIAKPIGQVLSEDVVLDD